MKNLAFIHYLISAIILFILLSLYLRKYRHNTQLIENLEEEREKNRSYIEDLDTLLSMLTRFQGLGMSYTKENDLQDFCNLIVEYSTDLLNTKMGSLMLKNKSLNKLEIVAARGLSEDVINSTKIPIGEGIAGRVAQNGKPIYCEDIVNDIRFMRNSRVKYSSSSFISVPLKVKNKVIGVLNVNSKKKDQLFTQRDLKLLSILADQAAVVIENMQLYGDMKSMYLGTMQTLAKAIEAKDPYTLGHTERVAKFAVMIARRMDLPPKLVRNIEYAALIHDIGKIGIEDSILTKPSKLSESEFEFIKKHPAIGEQIIAPVEFLTNVAPLVLYHHEYYNGQGYPEGLKGEEIPLGARILTVADSFEAMTSDRPYSKGRSLDSAIQELKDKSGSQFDPQIVEVFLEILEEERQKDLSHTSQDSSFASVINQTK